jgi:hypothetical protein
MYLFFVELGHLCAVHLHHLVCLLIDLIFHLIEGSLSQWLFLLHILTPTWRSISPLNVAYLSRLGRHTTLH